MAGMAGGAGKTRLDARGATRGTSVRVIVIALGFAALGLLSSRSTRVVAQEGTSLSGTWTIDRAASEFPRELGFGASFVPIEDGAQGNNRGRGGRPGGNNSPGGVSPALRPQGPSYDDGQRREQLTEEVRTPPTRLTIVESVDSVTMTDENGRSRAFHPDGRAETLQVGGVPVLTTARRADGKLIVLYAVEDLRQIRYTYSRSMTSPNQLQIDVEFLERGKGDVVRRVYGPPGPQAPVTTTAAASGSAPGPERAGAGSPAKPVLPRAGSEFTGLSRIGIVVEELSTQSVGCGLKRDEVEAFVAKPFADVGVRAIRNGDEDTYLYVNIMTSTLPTGMCISRWDWSISSTTDATLSYQRSPLLAQVLLARKGGLSGSMPPTHAADLLRGMSDGLTQIATIIRDANR
jgi:hypothetical protein